MTHVPSRIPPADPWSITLTYRHEHRWWFNADDAPETWYVSADIHDDSGTHVESHVADMNIVIVDVFDSRDPFSLLDGQDADLGAIAETIFPARPGSGRPTRTDRQPHPHPELNYVRLAPDWRGFGLGVLLTGTAIKKLSGGVRAAVCYAAPKDELDAEEADDLVAREHAITTLSRVWAQLGFEHFRHGLHVLDLSLVTLDEHLERLRKRAEQYRILG